MWCTCGGGESIAAVGSACRRLARYIRIICIEHWKHPTQINENYFADGPVLLFQVPSSNRALALASLSGIPPLLDTNDADVSRTAQDINLDFASYFSQDRFTAVMVDKIVKVRLVQGDALIVDHVVRQVSNSRIALLFPGCTW